MISSRLIEIIINSIHVSNRKEQNSRRLRFYDVTARVFMLEVPYNPINTITADNLLYIKYPYFTSTILKIIYYLVFEQHLLRSNYV